MNFPIISYIVPYLYVFLFAVLLVGEGKFLILKSRLRSQLTLRDESVGDNHPVDCMYGRLEGLHAKYNLIVNL